MSDGARRRRVLAMLGAFVLAGCAGIGIPRTITLSEAELQAQLSKRFPLQRTLLDSFELTLATPKLTMDAAANRIGAELSLQGSERRSGRSIEGRLTIDTALRWEGSDGTIRLVQPRIGSLEFAGADAQTRRRAALAQPLAAALAERLLDGMVLYRVNPERLEAWRAAGVQPAALQVTPGGLEVTIERVPAAAAAATPR